MRMINSLSSLALALTVLLHLAISISQSSITRERLVRTNDIRHATSHEEPDINSDRLSPVILLPGDGGSRLQARLNRRDVAHHYCERKTNDWFDLWLNLSLLVPFALDCWVDK